MTGIRLRHVLRAGAALSFRLLLLLTVWLSGGRRKTAVSSGN